MTSPPPKVLYIGGTGRTGSTLLERFLGQFPGFVAGGELAFIWRHGISGHGRCSCGTELVRCPFWAAVLERFDDVPATAARAVRLRRRFWSIHLPLMVSVHARKRGLDRLGDFPDLVEQLYRGMADVAGARVVIDSSKEPHYSSILRDRTDLDMRFLHLVRDSRDVARSWRKVRREHGFAHEAYMERRGALTSSIYYDVSNVAAEAIWGRDPQRYLRLRYEDFVADPAAALDAIAELIDEPLDTDEVLDGSSFVARDLHTAWGNPNRFDDAPTVIRADETWRGNLPPAAAAMVTAATAPLLHRYGYPLVPAGRARRR